MAENTYYTVLTQTGMDKIAAANAGGDPVELTTIHAGDGGGDTYYDDYDKAALVALADLVSEVWSAQLNDLAVDPDNPNWVVAEGVIPADTGGWMVREVGIKDAAGDLIAVGRFPPTYKPSLADGAAQDLLLRTIMEVSNAESVTLQVDPGVALASQGFVEERIDREDRETGQKWRLIYVDGYIATEEVGA
ncbi:phage tail protein [Arhodomonas aquaeolei]|uniref:phage tail protein n=1 Tax=Arhodomonas aquaeolei TaxID=2369 RepID=UPI00216AAE2E|nr:phage tail protein [Arhodomonas aquaeolei]MCS4503911.1 phage tail protein [Arhodomonas aquaeolei]